MAIGSEARSTFLAIVKGDASQAVTEFKKLGNSVEKSTKGATGSVGKFKQATSGAFAEIKANAGMMAAGAGAAIAGFTVHAAMQFSDLGVSIGKFSDATGLGLDAASRWTEVTGDLGIETSTLQSALNKMNRELDPVKFRQMGVAIAYTNTGATDVNATFLNVIDRLNEIKDPAERAKVATKLLGRNWMELSELIGKGSKDLRKQLDGVSDAKIYSPEKRKQAEQLRDVMADLRDVYEDFVLKVGALAAPILGELAGRLASVAEFALRASDAMTKLRDSIPGGGWLDTALNWPSEMAGAVADGVGILMDGEGEFDAFGVRFKVVSKDIKQEAGQVGEYMSFLADRHAAAAAKAHEMADAEKDAYNRTRDLRQAMQDLNDIQLDSLDAKADVITGMFELADAQKEYAKDVQEGTKSTGELAIAAHDLAVESADLAKQSGEVNGHQQTAAERTMLLMQKYNELQSTLEPGSDLWNAIQAYKDALLSVPSSVTTSFQIKTPGGGLITIRDTTDGKQDPNSPLAGVAANGTPSARRGTYLVGENGPELVSMRGGERVYPTPQTMAMLGGSGGGNVYNVTIAPRVIPTEREMIDLLNGLTRRQGAVAVP